MEKRFKITALLVGLVLVISITSIGCRLPATTTPTTAESIYIIIEPCLEVEIESNDNEPAPLITFEELSLEAGTLDCDYFNPDMGLLPQGDPCFLIMGIIENGYDEGCWVAYHATGYDDSGNTVSRTLDAGPIAGVAQDYIDGNSTEEFTLHLNWSDNVSIFKIRCQRSDVMFP